MKILTPKFYYFALNYHDLEPLLSAAFLDPAIENRTAHVDDDTTTLIELLTRAATLAKQEKAKKIYKLDLSFIALGVLDDSPSEASFHWRCLP